MVFEYCERIVLNEFEVSLRGYVLYMYIVISGIYVVVVYVGFFWWKICVI